MELTTPNLWTPGPWELATPPSCHPVHRFIQADGVTLAEVGAGGIGLYEHLANAKLMSASPDLFAALEKCVRHAAHYASMPHAGSEAYEDVAQAYAALAKAKYAHN